MVELVLSAEEQRFRQAAKDFVRANVLSRTDLDTHGHFPRELYQQAFEAGFVTAMIPKALGGGGRTTRELALAAEEFGYGDLGVATSTFLLTLATGGILNFGTPAQQEKWVRPLTRSLSFACHAWTEPQGSANLLGQPAQTTATEVDGGFLLDGVKSTISNASVASVYFVFARLTPGDAGLTCFAVPRDAEGVEVRTPYRKMGQRAADTAEVTFTRVFVPKEDQIGRPGEGVVIGMRALRASRVGIAAMSVGVARRARDLCIQHGHARVTGDGRRLIESQDFRFHLAEMEMELELVRALTWRACAELQSNGPEAMKLSCCAKLAGGNMAVKVTNQAIEMLGGLGYLEAGLAEKLYRDAKILQIYEGPQAVQKIMIADTVTRLGWVGH
ncbi:MAG: acyl-CoA/acyl-ACP dehydrogenase [Myxococcaceae bacterium]|nr:acyl-CoA/acyl-ACP dehydrogenase [Myxococcaceae bacterium]